MINLLIGFIFYSLSKLANFFVFLLPKKNLFYYYVVLLSIIALVLPIAQFLFLFVHIFVLTLYALIHSKIYLYCQRRRGFDAENTRGLFLFFCYLVYACIFVIASVIFVSYLSDFITSPVIKSSLDKWFYLVGFWISGVSYISVFRFLNKISCNCEYDFPEEI